MRQYNNVENHKITYNAFMNITKIAVHNLRIYDYNNTRGRESVLN